MTQEEFDSLQPGAVIDHPEYGQRVVVDTGVNYVTAVTTDQITDEEADDWQLVSLPSVVQISTRPTAARPTAQEASCVTE